MASLASCLSCLSDLVNFVFLVSCCGSVPSKEQISKILSCIQEEIETVQLDARLTLLMLCEISKVLPLIVERAEYQISMGLEARQISSPATPAQVKDFALCQQLQEIHTRITSMITGLPTIAANVLSPSLGAICGAACDSVTSLFQAMLDRLESCILQIHNQNFFAFGMDAAIDNNVAPYMEELHKCILHFRIEFLSRLPSSANATTAGLETIYTRLVRSMASWVLILLIRHTSLIRLLPVSGKLRIAELELAVGYNLFPVEHLGAQKIIYQVGQKWGRLNIGKEDDQPKKKVQLGILVIQWVSVYNARLLMNQRHNYNVADARLAQQVEKGMADGLLISCVASCTNLWALIMDAGTGSGVYDIPLSWISSLAEVFNDAFELRKKLFES